MGAKWLHIVWHLSHRSKSEIPGLSLETSLENSLLVFAFVSCDNFRKSSSSVNRSPGKFFFSFFLLYLHNWRLRHGGPKSLTSGQLWLKKCNRYREICRVSCPIKSCIITSVLRRWFISCGCSNPNRKTTSEWEYLQQTSSESAAKQVKGQTVKLVINVDISD